MSGYLEFIGYTLLVYLYAYGIIDRICKCIKATKKFNNGKENI